jgi:predicted MFS family arabinose efflux permease
LVIVVIKRDVSIIKCKIDYAGAILLSTGVAFVLLYATEGSTLGWLSAEELLFIVLGLALTVLFFFFESKASAPLVELKLLRIRNVLIANLITIVAGIANFLLFFSIVYYAEMPKPVGLGFDAFFTGLTLAPGTVVMFIGGIMAGRLLTKVGPKPILLAGASVAISSFILFIINRGSSAAVTVDVMVAFAGIVFLFVPLVNMISVSLPKDRVAVGQGLNTTLKQLGQSMAPVLTTTIMASYTQPITRIINGKTTVIGAIPSAAAFNIIFAVGIVFAVLCIALSLAIKNDAFKKENGKNRQPQHADA